MARYGRVFRSMAGAAALAGLAACGDGDGSAGNLGGLPEDDDSYAAMLDRLEALDDTPFGPADNAVPNRGTAVFDGYMRVNVSGAADPFKLTGTTRITADFANSTLTGDASDFEAERDGLISTYAGTINFQNGRIGLSPAPVAGEEPNDVRLDYVGTLTAPGSVVALNGRARGKLKGAPVAGLIAESDPTETVRLNGTDVGARVKIVAER